MDFYTYQYLRADGSPYYVGKGRGKRVWIYSVSHVNHRPPKDRSLVLVQYWSDEATAFAYERYLIDFWGRKDLGTGILRNRTDGGEGTAGLKRPDLAEWNRKNLKGKRLGPPSEEHKKHVSEAKRGKLRAPFSDEHKKNLGKASRQLWADKTPEERSDYAKKLWTKRRENAISLSLNADV